MDIRFLWHRPGFIFVRALLFLNRVRLAYLRPLNRCDHHLPLLHRIFSNFQIFLLFSLSFYLNLYKLIKFSFILYFYTYICTLLMRKIKIESLNI